MVHCKKKNCNGSVSKVVKTYRHAILDLTYSNFVKLEVNRNSNEQEQKGTKIKKAMYEELQNVFKV